MYGERVVLALVHEEPAGLAAPVRARLAEARCDSDGDAADVRRDDLELVALADRGLMDVAGEDQLGAGIDEPGEYVGPTTDRLLAGSPGSAEEVVVQDDDLEGARRRPREQRGGMVDLFGANAAGLVAPGPDGVQPDDVEVIRAVDRLARAPAALELVEGAGEAGEWGVGDVVVPRNGENGRAEALEEVRGPVVLVASTPVCEVAARDDELGVDPFGQVRKSRLQTILSAAADVEIRKVKESSSEPGHSPARLYTQIVVDEPAEIFDDLYLGLRAGGAMRKKRRGEPLTSEEEEAIGRWRRLGRARKILALGAFSVGTFGLGFTIGGLIFGRWRRA